MMSNTKGCLLPLQLHFIGTTEKRKERKEGRQGRTEKKEKVERRREGKQREEEGRGKVSAFLQCL